MGMRGGDSVQKIAWNMEAQSPGFGISLWNFATHVDNR